MEEREPEHRQHERNADGVGESHGHVVYDESNAVKRNVGLVVHLDGITKMQTFLFSEGSIYRWVFIAGELTLEVCEGGRVALHAPYRRVICVGGPQVLFRDGSWKG
jgi:hypothetical protein